MRQEPYYYEDAHGNRIIGDYKGLKFCFSGFNSVIRVGNGVRFREAAVYLNNEAEVLFGDNAECLQTSICPCNGAEFIVGDGVCLRESDIYLYPFARMRLEDRTQLEDSNVSMAYRSELTVEQDCRMGDLRLVLGKRVNTAIGKNTKINASKISLLDRAVFELGNVCSIEGLCLSAGEDARVLLEEECAVYGSAGDCFWSVSRGAELGVGAKGKFNGPGVLAVSFSHFKIGKCFSVNSDYHFAIDPGTSVNIGDDCMFSYQVVIRSNDGHSIFDVATGGNFNSTDDICKERKVIIGNHVWVGHRTYLLYNTEIGDGSIIGAGSLVKGRIPNNCIAVGTPAKVTKKNIAWSRKYGAEDIKECGMEYVHYTEEE